MTVAVEDAPTPPPQPAAAAPEPGLSYIRPSRGWQALDLPELWRFRELFWIFALRDVKVRYKQTLLGATWAIVQPLAFAVLGNVVFGRIAGAGTDGVAPAFVFYLASQLPWTLFNGGLQASSNSLVAAQNMIKKVYFPRLVIPASAVVVSLVDFLIALGVLALVLLALPFLPDVPAFVPPPQALLLPVAVAWAFLAALSVGLPLAALNVEFRDVRYLLPPLSQFMLFAAPVFWSATALPDAWRPLYGLVPVAGPIDFFRWALLGTPAHPLMWAVGAVSTALLLVIGLAYFRRMEDTFADVV